MGATSIELPQLGESVTEGVITAWLVAVGDAIHADQPIVEVSTDKVDTEIPSPVAGTVQELRAAVEETVGVGQVIAVIGDATAPTMSVNGAGTDGREQAVAAKSTKRTAAHHATRPDEAVAKPQRTHQPTPPVPAQNRGWLAEPVLTSPLVRRLLREAGIDTTTIAGTGPGGRITRDDAVRASVRHPVPPQAVRPAPAASAPAAARGAVTTPPIIPVAAGAPQRPEPSPNQVDFDGQREVAAPLSRVRKAIAKGMTASLASTAQLTAVVEVDMTAIMNLRAAVKDTFKAREGASLSPLPFICRAVTMTIPRHPAVNASIDQDGGSATFRRYVNLGIAVDTDRGLFVPNLKNAQDLTVTGLASGIADVATRARDKRLQPDEISGGTFTVTNTGSRGTLLDTPILNPPEVAILGACTIERRPVVISDAHGDAIAIRWMSYLCLTYDHRLIDGADAARFLQDLTWILEHHDFSGEVGV